jgi:hypothetical protein
VADDRSGMVNSDLLLLLLPGLTENGNYSCHGRIVIPRSRSVTARDSSIGGRKNSSQSSISTCLITIRCSSQGAVILSVEFKDSYNLGAHVARLSVQDAGIHVRHLFLCEAFPQHDIFLSMTRMSSTLSLVTKYSFLFTTCTDGAIPGLLCYKRKCPLQASTKERPELNK